ncbi:hypothetical protein ABGB09_34025 [Streptomyces sp. B8F3]|uniref:hypothetical protein n=1 Tax=Streptomyces sp. B8F3 TaxID=3153573 RepID=UPI00325DD536
MDFATRGAVSGIGYLQRRDDGQYDVRVGHNSAGSADSPETGMWACLKLHTDTKTYEEYLPGFTPYAGGSPEVTGTITFTGVTVEAACEAIDLAVEALVGGDEEFETSSPRYNVSLKAEEEHPQHIHASNVD